MARPPESLAGIADADCSETRAVVTGATSGIGRAVALALGRLGATVIVHGRDAASGHAVVDALEDEEGSAQFIAADFADLDAVSELARKIRTELDGIDYLFNNAGGLVRQGKTTELGVEYTFQINHLAPYYLTATLFDHLRDGASVVTTASAAHTNVSLDLGRVTSTESYSAGWAYGHSKLANVLFASELARRSDRAGYDLSSNSVHPGAIPGSGFSRFLPEPLPRVVRALDTVPGVTSVADGAAALLFVGLSPRTAGVSGRYFAGQTPTTPSAAARDLDNARRLWEQSAALLDIDLPVVGAENADQPADKA